jgi:hypothetical protein
LGMILRKARAQSQALPHCSRRPEAFHRTLPELLEARLQSFRLR